MNYDTYLCIEHHKVHLFHSNRSGPQVKNDYFFLRPNFPLYPQPSLNKGLIAQSNQVVELGIHLLVGSNARQSLSIL